MCKLGGRDHNATSYSTETLSCLNVGEERLSAEIITLRAIALKQLYRTLRRKGISQAEIITLRAIALKQPTCLGQLAEVQAEIITLRAIALKQKVV